MILRTFVAVELDPELRAALAGLQERLRRELRVDKQEARVQWVRPESLHLTLKFLGATEDSQLGTIEQALRERVRGFTRMTIPVRGLGTFPERGQPRVLWAGLERGEGTAQLIQLAATVEQAMAPIGFPPEGKALRPHLTLARIKEGERAVGAGLRDSPTMTGTELLGTLAVSAVALMQSDLQPSGAIYRRLFAVPLAA